ncbi:Cupredoxin, partial [Blastocladiella britannica]
TVWTYYVAADVIEWNYAPTGLDAFTGEPLDQLGTPSAVYMTRTTGRIGGTYFKAVYREYTDASKTDLEKRNKHLGILGPVLRGEVGHELHVVFKNNAAQPYSMHPHGVFYDKDNEGASMGPDAGAGASIAPGNTYMYRWPIPDRAGPTDTETDSIAWGYHSHISEADIEDGLFGALIVYRRGRLGTDGRPKLGTASFARDREFVLAFIIINENQSSYFARNLAAFAGNSTRTVAELAQLDPAIKSNPSALAALLPTSEFTLSNLMHSINGLVYGNLRGLDADMGDRIRFYVLVFGSLFDFHTIHWHGLTVESEGHRRDVIEALPATFRVADARVDAPGRWMMHCHVNDHFKGGMV